MGDDERSPNAPLVDTRAAALRTAAGTQSLNTVAPPPIFIRATFFDPIPEGRRPLPPHTWSLTKSDGSNVVLSTTSDAAGVSMLTLPLDESAKSKWVLKWSPVGATETNASHEICIDLDAVGPGPDGTTTLLGAAWVAPPSPGAIETRRLVRLLALDSKAKRATDGFELRDAGDAETDSLGVDGQLSGAAFPKLLASHGSASSPWDLQVDFHWFATWIAFDYYDLRALKTRAASPGLVVLAKNKAGAVMGAGVAVDASRAGSSTGGPGPVYVLHTRTREQSKDVEYTFERAERTIIDLENALFDSDPRPMRTVKDVATDVRTRYRLPTKWHSKGMAGWTDTADGSPIVWPWGDQPEDTPLRLRATTRFKPLHFNLDDVVLVDERKNLVPFVEKHNHVTVFDQLLTIRSPDAQMPHVTSDAWMLGNYLSGPHYTYVEGKDRNSLTRLVHYEGGMYSLREQRRTGTEGQTVALGARVAIENDHPRVDRRGSGVVIPESTSFLGTGRYQLHLIDTLVDDWVQLTSLVTLHHLVVAITVAIDKGDTSQEAVEAVLGKLDAAARWWNAGHPSAPEMAKKAYAIVPTDEPLKVVVLARHFFGHHERKSPGRGRILLHKNVHANFSTSTATIHITPEDCKLKGADVADVDGFSSRRWTLSHEFGHMFGLPDEYLDPHDFDVHGVLPKHNQVPGNGGPARPYDPDDLSAMGPSRVPRLRHQWHHVNALNHEPVLGSALGNRTFVAEYNSFTSPMYALPLRHQLKAVPPFAAPGDPWAPIARRVMPRKRAELFLYQLGEDEAAAGGLTGASRDFEGTGDLPLEAIVLLRAHFELKRAPHATNDDLNRAARAILTLIPPNFNNPTPAFALRRDGRPFARSLVVYQFGFGFSENVPGPAVRLRIEPEASEVENGLLLPEAAKPDVLHVKPSQCTWALVRYALEMASTTTSGGITITDDTTPTGAQIAGSVVDAELGTLFQDPAGYVRAWRSVMLKKR
jgi:hypothetical protein